MRCSMVIAGLLAACSASALWAGEGVPTQGKLNRLGLSSLEVASDEAGEAIRGRGFVKIVFNWQTVAGEKAVFDGNNLTIDPANFIANDTNQGSGITADGRPLSDGLAAPQVVNIEASSAHQHDVLSNGFSFSEISSSQTNATVIVGNATLLGVTP